jgi:tRNA pseudouridine13 synthase
MKLKQVPEDFIVRELPLVEPKASGKYTYFWLTKKGHTTFSAITHVARAMHLDLDEFGWAGNKDRHAVTEQLCSVYGERKRQLEALRFEDMAVKFAGYGDDPIHLGELRGNAFEIVVRDIDTAPKPLGRFVNYFGEQRFGRANAEIGKALVQRRWADALQFALRHWRGFTGRAWEAIKAEPGNYVGALRAIPRKILKFYIHAYQSRLWNAMAKEHAKSKHQQQEVLPIPGFGTVLTDPALKRVLHEEGLTPRQFIIQEFPELSSEGGERELYVDVQDLRIGKLEPDDLNEGRKKVRLSFELPKGCYATVFIGQLFQAA